MLVLMHWRTVKSQTSLYVSAVSPEHFLADTKCGISRRRLRPHIRPLAALGTLEGHSRGGFCTYKISTNILRASVSHIESTTTYPIV